MHLSFTGIICLARIGLDPHLPQGAIPDRQPMRLGLQLWLDALDFTKLVAAALSKQTGTGYSKMSG